VTALAGPGTVVLGIGNVLQRDDGIGVRVVRALTRAAEAGDVSLPAGTVLLDGGTRGRALLPQVAGARALVIVDALVPNAHPGRLTVLDMSSAAFIPPAGPIAELLATASMAGCRPSIVRVVGIEAGDTGPGDALTREIAAAIGPAMLAVLAELAATGGRAA
jgi:hydrogenase maturation protease